MSEQLRNQLSVALHIDVVFNLTVFAVFLFVRKLELFAFLVVIFCPVYAYGAFKRNSLINHWVSARLDYIDTVFLKWVIKMNKKSGRIYFRKLLPHNDLNVVFLDIPMPIDSLKFRKEKKPEDLWIKISEEDSDPLHIHKTTLDLAQQFIQDEKSLTIEELERLYSESNYKERELLEAHLPPDHPILLKIDEKLKIELPDGLTILK